MKKQSPAAERRLAAKGLDAGSHGAILRRAHRMQVARQLIGRVAYDFDDVLHSVLSALDTMHGCIEQNRHEDLGPLVDVASTSLHRAAVLSHHLLAFSRPKRSHARPVNANDVISSMSVLLRSMLGFEVGLEMRLATDLPNTSCDPVHLETIILNLALDARNAIDGRGRVVIDTCRTTVSNRTGYPGERNFVRIGVLDTGGLTVEIPRKAARGSDRQDCMRESGLERTSVFMARHFAAERMGHVDVDRHVDEGTYVALFLPCLDEDYGAREAVGLFSATPPGLPDHHVKLR